MFSPRFCWPKYHHKCTICPIWQLHGVLTSLEVTLTKELNRITNFPDQVGSENRKWTSPHNLLYVHIEDCEGWWLSGSVGKHWQLKPEVSWVRLPATASLFTFLYFRLMTSKFIYFQHEGRCSEHLEWKTTQHKFFLDGENFSVDP